MNIKKLRTIAAKGDVFEIDIDIFNADMEMVSTEKPALFIQFSKGFRPTFKERDGTQVCKMYCIREASDLSVSTCLRRSDASIFAFLVCSFGKG